jgi:hypothetical protein
VRTKPRPAIGGMNLYSPEENATFRSLARIGRVAVLFHRIIAIIFSFYLLPMVNA